MDGNWKGGERGWGLGAGFGVTLLIRRENEGVKGNFAMLFWRSNGKESIRGERLSMILKLKGSS